METTLSEAENKIADLTKVNDVLHEQIQELGLKVAVFETSSVSGVNRIIFACLHLQLLM